MKNNIELKELVDIPKILIDSSSRDIISSNSLDFQSDNALNTIYNSSKNILNTIKTINNNNPKIQLIEDVNNIMKKIQPLYTENYWMKPYTLPFMIVKDSTISLEEFESKNEIEIQKMYDDLLNYLDYLKELIHN